MYDLLGASVVRDFGFCLGNHISVCHVLKKFIPLFSDGLR
jgi:hypothetical protein